MNETTLIADLTTLVDAVACDVVLPGRPGYESLRRVWNADIDQHPAAIVRCRTAQDAADALRWCLATGTPLTVRGGGHNLAGTELVGTDAGISRFLAPIGAGTTDWDELVSVLLDAQPGIDLAIEGIGGSRAEMTLTPRDAFWRSLHPDMTEDDVTELERLVAAYPAQADRGTVECVDLLRARPPARADYIDFLQRSRTALGAALAARLPSLEHSS